MAILCSAGGSAFFAARELLKNRSVEFVVVTDRPCGAEAVCEEERIPWTRITAATNSEFSEKALAYLHGIGGVDYIALLFSRLITPALFGSIPCFNIHPSLLPAFPGMKAVQQARAANAKYLGATLHFVDEGIDTGPILAQVSAPIPHQVSDAALDRISFAQKTYLLLLLVELLAQKAIWIAADLSGCALKAETGPPGPHVNPVLKSTELRESFRKMMVAENISWAP